MEIDKVIAESPVSIDTDEYFMVRSDTNSTGESFAAVRDAEEATIVVSREHAQLEGHEYYGPLKRIRLAVALPFAAPGFLARALRSIADTDTPALVISTYSYDFVFVSTDRLPNVMATLRDCGFQLVEERNSE